MENLRLHEESRQIQMENLQMKRQTQQKTNMFLATFMKMNPDLLQALPVATPSPLLMIGNVASGSLFNGSSTQEEEAAQAPQHQVNDPIPPTVVCRGIEDDTPTSSAMHPSSAEVTRAETALVVPESPTNLEIDALEIEGGSDELGFSDAVVGSDT